MGNVIPWSQIDPSIKSHEPFAGVVVIDPQRKLCVSEILPLDEEMLAIPQAAARQVIALAQRGSTGVARAYQEKRRAAPAAEASLKPKLEVVRGGLGLPR
jgi:hypothetical protein